MCESLFESVIIAFLLHIFEIFDDQRNFLSQTNLYYNKEYIVKIIKKIKTQSNKINPSKIPSLHMKPLGQQWTPSEQHVAFGKGQHPY